MSGGNWYFICRQLFDSSPHSTDVTAGFAAWHLPTCRRSRRSSWMATAGSPRRSCPHGKAIRCARAHTEAFRNRTRRMGTIRLVFAPEGRDKSTLAEHEIGLVRWVVDHQAAVHDGMLRK